MGVSLVGAAMNPYWATRLKAADRTVLITMAFTALDTPTRIHPARIYWAGYEPIMLACYGRIPDRGTPNYRTLAKRVQDSIRALIEVGAIERVQDSSGRRHARYKMTLDNFPSTPREHQ